jgi:hypothetical protein
MYIQRRHWLDYDPVALAALVKLMRRCGRRGAPASSASIAANSFSMARRMVPRHRRASAGRTGFSDLRVDPSPEAEQHGGAMVA